MERIIKILIFAGMFTAGFLINTFVRDWSKKDKYDVAGSSFWWGSFITLLDYLIEDIVFGG